MGKYTINDRTISQIALYAASRIPGIGSGGRVYIENYASGVVLKLELTVLYGMNLPQVLTKVQEKVAQVIEYMTGLNVIKVNILVKNVYFNESL